MSIFSIDPVASLGDAPSAAAPSGGSTPPPSGSAPSSVQSFVEQNLPAAQRVAERLGVAPEAVLGQWGLETGWGKKVISGTNNLGNIKDPTGKGVWATDNATKSNDAYRKYASTDEFADDFARLLSSPRYANAVGAGGDYQAYFSGLKRGGYAEDKDYVAKGVSAANMAAQALGGQTQALRTVNNTAAPGASVAPGGEYFQPQNTSRFANIPQAGQGATLGDFAKEVGASALEAVGGIGQMVGEGLAYAANKATGTEDYEGKNLLKPASTAIRGTMTEGGKQAARDANVEGSVVDLFSGQAALPESVDGWLMMGASGFGSLLPTIGSALVGGAGKAAQLSKAAQAAQAAGDATKAAQLLEAAEKASRVSRTVGALTGGAMTGGAAAGDVRETAAATVAKMPHEQLMEQVPLYAETFNRTGDEAQARSAVVNNAARWAGGLSAIAGAAGGYVNARLFEDFLAQKGMAAIVGNSAASRLGRAAIAAPLGAMAEGGQETTEKFGQNVGENIALGRQPMQDALRNTAGDFLGGALVGGPVAGVGGVAAPGQKERPRQEDPAVTAVQERAAQGNSPLSAAAAAGNAAAPQPTTPELPTDPLAERVSALDQQVVNNDVIAALRSEASPVDARQFVGDLALARSPSAPQAAREQALARIEFAIGWVGENMPAAPAQGEAPATATATLAETLSDRDFMSRVTPTDREQLLGISAALRATGENGLPAQTRSNMLREALQIIGQYQAPAAETATAPSGPGALLTPAGQPAATPATESAATPGQPQVAALLAPKPGPAPAEGVTPPPQIGTGEMTPAPKVDPAVAVSEAVTAINQVTDSPLDALRAFNAQEIANLFDLRGKLTDESTPLPERAQIAEQVKSLLGADIATPAATETAAPTATSAEASAQPAAGSAAPDTQQTVAPTTENAVEDVAAPEIKTAPAGPGPAVTRKRRAALDQLAGMGFDRVERRDDGFYFVNPSKRQQFKLDGMADAALARAAAQRALNAAAQQAATSNENDKPQPTEAQAKAGQYAKGDITFDGLKIAIENPVGSTRSGTDPKGEKWSVDMTAHYGFVRRTEGADGDQVDVYVPTNARPGSPVFVFDQHNEDGSFDEHKAVLGVRTPEEAQRIYDAHFSDGSGPRRRRAVTQMTMDEFKVWSKSPEAKMPGAAVPTGQTTVFPASGQPQTPLQAGTPIFERGTERPVVVDESAMPQESVPPVAGGGKPLTSKTQAAMLRAVANVFGKQIVFFDGINDDGFVMPSDHPDRIFLNIRSGISPLAVFGHELMHLLKRQNPAAYAAIARVIRTKVKDPKGFRNDYYGRFVVTAEDGAQVGTFRDKPTAQAALQAMGGKGSITEQTDKPLAEAELEELISDLNGNLMRDQKFWREVFAEIAAENGDQSMGIIAKLVAFIQTALDNVVAAFQGRAQYKANTFVKDAKEVRAALRSGLAAYAKSVGVSPNKIQAQVLREAKSVTMSADRGGEPDWMTELFGGQTGEAAPAPAQPAKRDYTAAVPVLRRASEAALEQAKDWASRQYKANRRTIALGGDGPRRSDVMSVSAANESRRRRNVESFTEQARNAERVAKMIERGDNVEAIVQQAVASADNAIKRDGRVTIGKTREDQVEASISNELFGRYAYGPDTPARILREAHEGGDVKRSADRGETIEVDGVQRPRLNSDGKPIHSTDDGVRNFWRWFGNSQFVDGLGRPEVVYHGSDVGDITEFTEQRTNYGYYFSPDYNTAAYYTGRDDGGRVYAVYLRANKVADLDDDAVFDEIAREAVDFNEERDPDSVREFAARLYEQGYGVNPAVTKFFDGQDGIKDVGDDYTIEELLSDNYIDQSEIDPLVKEIGTDRVKRAYDEAAPIRSEELEQVREAYGGQDFYMNYQRDFLRAAENLGYDGVIFSDPSSSGESTSYVVFNSNQIKSAEDNSGAFNPDDADIQRSAEREPTTPFRRGRKAPSEADVMAMSREQLIDWLQSNDPNGEYADPEPNPNVEMYQTARGWTVENTEEGDEFTFDNYNDAREQFDGMRFASAEFPPLTLGEAREIALNFLRESVWPAKGGEVVQGQFGQGRDVKRSADRMSEARTLEDEARAITARIRARANADRAAGLEQISDATLAANRADSDRVSELMRRAEDLKRTPAPTATRAEPAWTADLTPAQRRTLREMPEYEGDLAMRAPSGSPEDDLTTSAQSHFTDYEVARGVRGVPLKLLGDLSGYDDARESRRVRSLADAIRDSGEITPIFVGLDASGEAYVMEGQHRARAVKALGMDTVPARVVVDMSNADEVAKADAYKAATGFRPYTSQGKLEITVDVLRSVKREYTDKELERFAAAGKPKQNHPILGLPLNADGTVTLYVPTTEEESRRIARERTLKAAPGMNRIYLTNESSIGRVMENPAGIEQELGGANVLIHVDPSLLQLDKVHEDGRRDFFIPIAEGSAFKDKMSQWKLFTMNKSRSDAISKDTSISDIASAITASVDEFRSMSKAERRARLEAARKNLKDRHNVTTLLSENGKLQKTRLNEYELPDDIAYSVASMGLGLASAQKINEKLNSCPQAARCESLCLGETSGQNLLYGGEGSFRSGPRLSQYLKTEALVLSPADFAVVLYSEIEAHEKWANKTRGTETIKDEDGNRVKVPKQVYTPAIRLNVTSDFPPKVFASIINAFDKVRFYDYTKLNSQTIAPNHHLTYSSTGVAQEVNGKIIGTGADGKPGANWAEMTRKLDKGFNVAMAFTSRNDMPDFLKDEATGKVYEVWNGDNYDARFLDPKRVDENGNPVGMIIGLTNKDRTGKPEDAALKYDGFFVDYDRKRDGGTLLIRDQKKLAELAAKQGKPIQIRRRSAKALEDAKEVRLSRDRWTEGLPIVDEGEYEGGPAVFVAYHGTTHDDITVFKRKGDPGGFLGEGPYFTTSPEDASVNYAGVGPDLTMRIDREAERLAESFNDDDYVAEEMVRDYLNDLGIEDEGDLEDLKDAYGERAIEHAARKMLKGASDGLMMKSLVKLKNPADTVNGKLTYNVERNDDGDVVSESGTLLDWISAAQEVGPSYGSWISRYTEALLEEADDGDVPMSEAFRLAQQFLDGYDESGNSITGGGIFTKIAEEAGYDGVVMDADLHFGSGRRGFGGFRTPGMDGIKRDTLHIVPFNADAVKSATGNVGAYGQRPVTGEEAARLGFRSAAEANAAQARGDVRLSRDRQIDTPAFKRWFGQSKAVVAVNAETGRPVTSSREPKRMVPQVMYHTTRGDFSEFQVGRVTRNSGTFGDWETSRAAIFVTPEIEASQAYGTTGGEFGEGANVMPLYVRAENPLDLTSGVGEQDEQRLIEAGMSPRFINNGLGDWSMFDDEEGADLVEMIRRAGYDSVIFNDQNPDTGESFEAWALFDPEQIKSAIGNSGSFDPGSADIRRSSGREPQWYSQLQRAIAGVPDRLATMAAPQWSQWLKANAGKLQVKAEEITWSGIEDYLKLRGKDKITRDELAAWVGQNGVRVEETVLGRGFDKALREELTALGDIPRSQRTEAQSRRIAELSDLSNAEDTKGRGAKYGDYTLPGGENYREVLLTLPISSAAIEEEAKRLATAPWDGMSEQAKENVRSIARNRLQEQGAYRSSHWDQPNVLAHLRVNDRTDADGNRVLFVEELQSDWGQQGKKQGFRQAADNSRATEADIDVREIRNPYTGYVGYEAFPRGNDAVSLGRGEDRAQVVQEALARLRSSSYGDKPGLPTAPFVTKTDSWLGLALKRVLLMATREGYDKVAFTTGQQNADRYSLDRFVDHITYEPTEKGFYINVMADGQNVKNGDFTTDQLEGIVGKEIVQKMINREGPNDVDPTVEPDLAEVRRLSGDGLKVEATGMREFYDKIVPQTLNKLLPKVGGGKVETVTIVNGESDFDLDEIGNATEEELRQLQEGGIALQQPGFTITPEMRDQTALGLPLFSRSRVADKSSPYEEDILGAEIPKQSKTKGSEVPVGEYGTETALVVTRKQKIGAKTVRSSGDAANALSYLGRGAVERFDAILTGKGGKPLAIIGGFKGSLTQTPVFAPTLMGEAILVPGATDIWFVHNHPSGTPRLSNPDLSMHRDLVAAFKGSGITPRELLAIGKTQWNSTDGGSGEIEPSDSGATVPVQEREYVRRDELGAAISSPREATIIGSKLAARNGNRAGLMLLNTANQPIAYVPWVAEGSEELIPSGRLRALYKAVSLANANSAILVDPHGEFAPEQYRNIGRALVQLDARLLDVVQGENSRAPGGRGLVADVLRSSGRPTEPDDEPPTGGGPGRRRTMPSGGSEPRPRPEVLYSSPRVLDMMNRRAQQLLQEEEREDWEAPASLESVALVRDIKYVNDVVIPLFRGLLPVANRVRRVMDVQAFGIDPQAVTDAQLTLNTLDRAWRNLVEFVDGDPSGAVSRGTAAYNLRYHLADAESFKPTLLGYLDAARELASSLNRRSKSERQVRKALEEALGDNVVDLKRSAERAVEQGFLTENQWNAILGEEQSGRGDRLKRFFHGTGDDVTPGFTPGHRNKKDSGWLGDGIYVTDDPELAYSYSMLKKGGAAPNVMPLAVRVRKPYIATMREKRQMARMTPAQVTATTKRLIDNGYDSVLLNYEKGQSELVVLNGGGGDVRSYHAEFKEGENPSGDLLFSRQRAWHGTQAREIKKFSTDFMGTGEGAQAYGWGLYFASRREIGEHYRRKLAGDGYVYKGKGFNDLPSINVSPERNILEKFMLFTKYEGADEQEAISRIRSEAEKHLERTQLNLAEARENLGKTIDGGAEWGDLRMYTYTEEDLASAQKGVDYAVRLLDMARSLKPGDIKKSVGQLYEVEIPKDSEMLDWDKPMRSQPQAVREAVAPLLQPEVDRRNAERERMNALNPERLKHPVIGKIASKVTTVEDIKGQDAYEFLSKQEGSDKDASALLAGMGIKGIKYLDGSSRADGDGTHNYVVFSGDDVDVIQTYYSRDRVTNTPEFQEWFGDSKVVDRDGKPLVVYHGTPTGDITQFNVSTSGTFGGGIYTTPDAWGASLYATRPMPTGQQEAPTVYPVFVSIQNPAPITEAIGIGNWRGSEAVRDELMRRGYDGVIDWRGGEIVAFRPEQVKSVFNLGTFDPENPDILASRQRAWHGTPHRGIDKFSTEFLGTGEGAQAYGHGLYFASKRDVAEYYRNKLSTEVKVDGEKLASHPSDGPLATAHNGVVTRISNGATPEDAIAEVIKYWRDAATEIAELAKGMSIDPARLKREIDSREAIADAAATLKPSSFVRNPGQLYEVEIPGDDEMLDWDKPIGSQPAKVKEALKQSGLWKALKDNLSDFSSPMDTRGKLNGGNIYAFLAWKLGSEKAASERLLELGIPGLRYPAGQIAGVKGGGYNYVIFSGDDVAIQQTYYSRDRQTETPEFKAWFGESEVVDEKGRPLVVYHGSSADITEFRSAADRNEGLLGQAGIYFTSEGALADYYGREGAVYPVYLSIQNPFDLTSNVTLDGWRGALAKVLFPRMASKAKAEQQLREGMTQSLITEKDRDRLVAAGYDGIKGVNGVWIAFRPEQVKSAIGNSGAFNPNDPDIRRSVERTPEFKAWFGKSKVVDDDGNPRIVYRGMDREIENGRFRVREDGGTYGPGIYASTDPQVASFWAGDMEDEGFDPVYGGSVYPVYISLQNPADGDTASEIESEFGAGARDEMIRRGYDGVMAEDGEIVAFYPSQIKSVFNERPTNDPDILRSTSRVDQIRDFNLMAGYKVADLFDSSKSVGWWDKTVGTMYRLAEKQPLFKRVYDAVQAFINDTSRYATRAADLAPTILPKLENLRDITKTALSAEDVKALAGPVFEGTLRYERDAAGNAVETDDVGKAGIVWKDEELRQKWGLDDRQIGLYREFRRAANKSIGDLAITDMLRYAGDDAAGVRSAVLAAGGVQQAADILVQELEQQASVDPARAGALLETVRVLKEKANAARGLMAKGYAPLSRYGDFTVYAVSPTGEQLYFGMFETQREANRMARQMREQYPEADVKTGTMSKESYKLFSGVTPETLALFGQASGLEGAMSDDQKQAFDDYLKLAKSNRSAMKRLIERKGIAGYSEDVGRVLAGFVYSNARQASVNLHAGEIGKAVWAIKEAGPQKGDLLDQAVKLMQYVQNGQEEAQKIRGLLFAQYIGGSVASAMSNLTQSVTTTWPTLSMYFGIGRAGRAMTAALGQVKSNAAGDPDLQAAMKRAEEEGITAPQEVHHLMAQAQGRGSLQTGDGTKVGDALAKINNGATKLQLIWGKAFGFAEQLNRKIAFAAAYSLARDRGDPDPFGFAKKIVGETQFTMNKGNNPNWARGPIGATLFTFRKFMVNYLEMLARLWGGGPEGKKAFALALGVLFLLAGMSGMPGADDLDDLIDGFAQRVLNKNWSTRQAKKEFFAKLLGDAGADFVMSGLSGLPGVPLDVSGRLGLGNLVPGTGIATKKNDYSRDVLEVGGAAADFVSRVATATGMVAQGDVRNATETAMPLAASNAYKALQMAQLGYYKDARNRKVVDTDLTDATLKLIGFQPKAVSQVQEATRTAQKMIALNKLRESEIAALWTRGRVERNPDMVEEAKRQLAAWNRDNPTSPIEIDAAQINRRVQQANMSKAQRIGQTAPKEIRQEVRRQIEADMNQR